jgi:hypothetical protein
MSYDFTTVERHPRRGWCLLEDFYSMFLLTDHVISTLAYISRAVIWCWHDSCDKIFYINFYKLFPPLINASIKDFELRYSKKNCFGHVGYP